MSNNEDGAILVLEAVAPQSGCTVTAQLGEPGITHGAISSAIETEYELTAQFQSRIVAATGQEANRTIVMNGANVDLTFPNSTLFSSAQLADMKSKGITHFKSLFTAPLQPNAGITDASFTITPHALYDAIYAVAPQARKLPTDESMDFELEILANITVFGKMDGGDVSSQPFQFAIGMSNFNGVVQLVDPSTCPAPVGTTILTGNACGLPQDAAVTCCMSGEQLVCPAPLGT